MTDYQTDLDHALRLADVADKITMRYFRAQDLVIKDKPDHTPVTQGDLETEKALSEIVINEFHEEYLGEEGTRTGKAGKVWVVDPIDGTKNFMRGLPLWGTLIALVENGETVVAMVSCPALGRRWWATKGQGAWTQDIDGTKRKLHVSAVSQLEHAFILHSGTVKSWDRTPNGEKAIHDLLNAVWRYRAPGDFINYMWLAEGAADVALEPYTKRWDIEAPRLIVTEAGGNFWTDATEDTPADADRIAIATNGPLESPVLKALGL